MIAVAVLGSNANAVRVAGRLAAAGYVVRTWGTAEAGAAGSARPGRGPRANPTPAGAAAGARALLTCVEDPDDLRALLTDRRAGALGAVASGAWWLNLAPAAAATNEEFRALARSHALTYQHTPLIGEHGDLLAVGPAAADARAFCDPVLGAIAPVVRAGTPVVEVPVSAVGGSRR
ncbi:NAD(P)-binding domain-containing protein [Kitasatospora sp. NPDC101176]|uniref:NAD(P)-binding domain-containing protein n=1 Tax=Kitasatospora sp. NPDC101176 TaxID=3364099 RepID=UPI00381A30A4